jgi:glucose-6-phosphate 1-dehydrogenase
VEAQWRIIDPILEGWEQDESPLPTYAAGSQGPEEAESILAPGQHWRAV